MNVRDSLAAGKNPEFAVSYPKLIYHNAVVPVHYFQKKQCLKICRSKIRKLIPQADNQNEDDKHDDIKFRHKDFSLAVHFFAG